MITYKVDEIQTLNINSELSCVGEVFLKNNESIYIIDSENYLCGIITFSVFLKRFPDAKSIQELMDSNFIRIEQTSFIDENNIKIEKIANVLFLFNTSWFFQTIQK